MLSILINNKILFGFVLFVIILTPMLREFTPKIKIKTKVLVIFTLTTLVINLISDCTNTDLFNIIVFVSFFIILFFNLFLE